MNFYYDPILGLQYDYLGETFTIDKSNIPKPENNNTLKSIFKLISEGSFVSVTCMNSITQYKL